MLTSERMRSLVGLVWPESRVGVRASGARVQIRSALRNLWIVRIFHERWHRKHRQGHQNDAFRELRGQKKKISLKKCAHPPPTQPHCCPRAFVGLQ